MGFIPEWAVGVGFIMIALLVGQGLRGVFHAMRGPSVRPTLPASNDEARELRQDLEAMQNRLAEVEERLDFAERLLTKQREADRLGPTG